MPLDPSAQIAPTARIHPEAIIGPGAVIGEFAIVEQDVTIGAQTRLEPYVYVKRWTTLGEGNEISAGTVLGTDPLDKNFTGARSYLRIGNDNKMNGALNSEAASRKTLRTVDFQCRRHCSLRMLWLGRVLPGEISPTLCLRGSRASSQASSRLESSSSRRWRIQCLETSR